MGYSICNDCEIRHAAVSNDPMTRVSEPAVRLARRRSAVTGARAAVGILYKMALAAAPIMIGNGYTTGWRSSRRPSP